MKKTGLRQGRERDKIGQGVIHMETEKKHAPNPPEVPSRPETGASLQETAELAAREARDVMGFLFQDDSLGDVSGNCLEFDRCVFLRCVFSENHVKRMSFVDCVFDHSDLSNMRFEKTTFQRVRFVSCRMTGVSFGDAALTNAELTSCNLDYASFEGTRLDRSLVSQCRMRESIWSGVTFSRMSFEKTDLTQAQWHRTPMKGIDLRGCEITGWAIAPGDLRGLTVTSLQALELSKLLGIVVEDDI